MKRRTQQIGRRRFLKAVPATVAAGVALPAIAPSTVSAQRGGATPARPEPVEGRVSTDALKGAEQIAGLRFTDAEEEAALNGVSRNLDAYETLRKLDIPLDTEPAITFRPGKRHETPGAPPPGPGRSSRNAKLAIAKPARVQVNGNLEALAFEPVTALASLIESRKISSTDLTKMYLARLKRYGEPLHCVITLTEDLALAQAANADKELKAGRYRGALHGIPWGAKDLLATKGIRTTWGAKPYENQLPDLDATVVERLREAAAGLVGFSIGTETRGSIIPPSSTCGLVGLRPTYGRVSRYGAMALILQCV